MSGDSGRVKSIAKFFSWPQKVKIIKASNQEYSHAVKKQENWVNESFNDTNSIIY